MSQPASTLLFLLPPSVFTDASIDVPADGDAQEQPTPLNDTASPRQDDANSEPAAEASGSTCHTCHIGTGTTPGFASLAEQREHFKTDWHRFNIKRTLAKQPPLSEAEFAALLDHDEVHAL